MKKLFAIIKREYLTRVRSKGFIIGTIISPLIMMGFAIVPYLLARSSGPDKYRIVVLDQNGDDVLIARFQELLLERKAPRAARYELTREVVGGAEALDARRQALTRELQAKEAGASSGQPLDGYMILPADALAQKELVFYARNAANFTNRTRLAEALDKAVLERRAAIAGMNPDLVRQVTRGVDLRIVNERGESERGRLMLSFSLLMVLYITILIYGISVLRGVTEEKQSRIIEVLLASVRPFELMLGKVVGIGLVGLTQYLVWATSAILMGLLSAGPLIAFGGMSVPKIPPSLLVFFVIYYLLGYLLYATLYAMVGAIVSNEDDAQQMQTPVTMTFVVAIILATFVMQNPSGRAATILSLFPFFTPALMFLRIAFNAAPAWQIALSIALMIGTILGCVWVAAKIYRVGVLMHGKRPSLPELMRWLKYS
ncbi:MAG: ABC transporter permease [Blastocatellia bacterium]|nr:ABC transporter permease [Blastocatellia bacterium]